jgi:hypothetical protein
MSEEHRSAKERRRHNLVGTLMAISFLSKGVRPLLLLAL